MVFFFWINYFAGGGVALEIQVLENVIASNLGSFEPKHRLVNISTRPPPEVSWQSNSLSPTFLKKSCKKPNGRCAPRRQAAIEPFRMGSKPPNDIRETMFPLCIPSPQAPSGSIKCLSGIACRSVPLAENKKYPPKSIIKGIFLLIFCFSQHQLVHQLLRPKHLPV